MSTSEDLTVAGDYSCNGQSGEKPLIMKLKIPKNGINQYGGELKWVPLTIGAVVKIEKEMGQRAQKVNSYLL